MTTTDKSANNSTEGKPAPATRQRRPPDALFKVINPVIKALLRSPLQGRLSGALMLLSFKGRKTGKIITTPVGYHHLGDDLVVFTGSPWKRNLRGGASVTLLLKGKKVKARAEMVEDPEEVYQTMKHFLDKIGVKNAQRLGLMIDRSHEPTEEELRAATADKVVIRIKPEGGASS